MDGHETKVLLIGHFDLKEINRSGQVERVKNVSKLMTLNDYSVQEFSFEGLESINSIFRFVLGNRIPTNIVLCTSFKALIFLDIIFSVFLGKRTILIPTGGWFVNKVERNWVLKRYWKSKNVFVQGASMSKELLNIGFSSVRHLPNFRLPPATVVKSIDSRFGYIGRISSTKGVFDILAAIGKSIPFYFYGPIDKEIKSRFLKEIALLNNVKYCGVYSPHNVWEVLKEIKCLVFPTFYQGEGQPGVLIEAVLSSTPVIATEWNFNGDVVEHGKNGFLVPPNSPESLKYYFDFLTANHHLIGDLASNALELGKKYDINMLKIDL